MRSVALVLLLVAIVAADLAPLLRTESPTAISGSYIVILQDGTSKLDRDHHILSLKQAIMATGDVESEIGFSYHFGGLVGFSAKLSSGLLKQELAHPLVKFIEADQTVSINYEVPAPTADTTVTQTGATWGLDRTDQRALPLNGLYVYNSSAGENVDVFVIDTGIYVEHTDFAGRATFAFNAITTEGPEDGNGHGTHCAGTIGGTTYGVAKGVSLKAVKVLSAAGSGTYAGVVAGVDYVTNSKTPGRPAVASMSLGGGPSDALDAAIIESVGLGVVYSIAAGNNNANACNYSPARVNVLGAVTVGATTNTDARASYSNYGTCVDIFAPGSSITSDWIGSPTATNTISGTSMATPHVAGVLALHLSIPDLQESPSSVATWLHYEATPNVVSNPGTGSPNRLLFSPPGHQ